MRLSLAALSLILLTGAAQAQTLPLTSPPTAAQVSPAIANASHALAAIWRPLAQGAATAAALETVCNGAIADMDALDEAIPDPLTAEGLAAVHPAHGLVFVPTADDASALFMFPSADLAWFSSGLGSIVSADEASGAVTLRDAGGHVIHVVLGRAAGRTMLRLESPTGTPATYVGCAPTVN